MQFVRFLEERSQLIINAVRATVLFLTIVSVISVTPEQLAAGLLALEAVFAVVTAKTTVPEVRIDTIVDKRVQAHREGVRDAHTECRYEKQSTSRDFNGL